MPAERCYIPYKTTGAFSSLVEDYVAGDPRLKPFFRFTPDAPGLSEAIEQRKQFPVNRKTLVSVLKKQYEGLDVADAVSMNLEALSDENTFTICTAHQPNLLTGYAYFIYKIIHAIRLAGDLNAQHPSMRFVPVYYMGSEDNDLEELGVFRYGGEKYVWDAEGQKGAVGRMKTKSLKPLLDKLFKVLGPPTAHTALLKEAITNAYLKHDTIGAATQYLVNELFGRYGLIVLDPDDASFKRSVAHIMKDDLLHHQALGLVEQQVERLSEHYKAQAFPRAINLFYLADGIRERIEKTENGYEVLNTDIRFTEAALLNELDEHPERFSPNVILRGLLQETILPDVAFIGGGAEVAYWLQLRPVFDHYKVFYPAILLRQSVLWIGEKEAELRRSLQLSISDIFLDNEALYKKLTAGQAGYSLHLDHEQEILSKLMEQMQEKAEVVDKTLKDAAGAALARIKKQVAVLELKMYRAEKKKQSVQLARVDKFKSLTFPHGSLQERTDNFMNWFTRYGHGWFDELKSAIDPLRNEFLVLEETH